MKEQTSPAKEAVLPNEPLVQEVTSCIPDKQERGSESDEDSGFLNASNVSLNTCDYETGNNAQGQAEREQGNAELELSKAEHEDKNAELEVGESGRVEKNADRDEAIDLSAGEEPEPWRLKIPPRRTPNSDENLKDIVGSLFREYDSLDESDKESWLLENFSQTFGEILPSSLIEIMTAHPIDGDTGISLDSRPDWLDIDKFKRGQKFALDNAFGLSYANMLSLFVVFSFDEGLKPIIVTGASSTPYTAFKRYLSTGQRIQNWYKSDPWSQDSEAHADVKAVRRMHAMVRRRLEDMSDEELEQKSCIRDAWCPTLSTAVRDFESTCPAPKPGQCPQTILTLLPRASGKKLSQAEMISTQFAFVGLGVLHPKFFGMHGATEDDLEAFCHVWRGIGYLLGIDDRFNLCRGSLSDVRRRSSDFLEYWAKPNFRVVKPEWEHMMRCMIEGVQYYFPGSTFETALLDVAQLLNLHTPRLYDSLSYSIWIKHGIVRFFFDYGAKLAAIRSLMNRRLAQAIEKARKFDEETHKRLQERSAKTLEDYLLSQPKSQGSVEPCTEG